MREEREGTRLSQIDMCAGPMRRPKGMPMGMWKLCLARHAGATRTMAVKNSSIFPGFMIYNKDGSHKGADIIVQSIGDLNYALKHASDTMKALIAVDQDNIAGAAITGHWAMMRKSQSTFPCMIAEGNLYVCGDEGEVPEGEYMSVWKLLIMEWMTPVGVDWDVYAHKLDAKTNRYSVAFRMSPERRDEFSAGYSFPLRAAWRARTQAPDQN